MIICFGGHIVSILLPFDFPSALISLFILLLLLFTGIIKEDHIKDAGDFLMANMAFFFIPSGITIMEYFGLIKSIWWQFILIALVATFATFMVTSGVVTLCLKLKERKKS